MTSITFTDGMARVKKSGPRKCSYCKALTPQYLLWADGRATWPACSKHKLRAEKDIKKNGKWACIVGWRKYP
jgi:hypothetical protein